MQIKSIAVFLTCIKLSSVFKTFVLSIFEWPLKTGFTVTHFDQFSMFDLILYSVQFKQTLIL